MLIPKSWIPPTPTMPRQYSSVFIYAGKMRLSRLKNESTTDSLILQLQWKRIYSDCEVEYYWKDATIEDITELGINLNVE